VVHAALNCRFDEQVVFHKLSRADVTTIASLMMAETRGRVVDKVCGEREHCLYSHRLQQWCGISIGNEAE
jgi:ATP-dependent Clp protease ATP-binding subunit ClpA